MCTLFIELEATAILFMLLSRFKGMLRRFIFADLDLPVHNTGVECSIVFCLTVETGLAL